MLAIISNTIIYRNTTPLFSKGLTKIIKKSLLANEILFLQNETIFFIGCFFGLLA
jgi:hypothetical protein